MVGLRSGAVVIDRYDAAAKTISGHFAAAGKDDDGEPSEITSGGFSGVQVSPQ